MILEPSERIGRTGAIENVLPPLVPWVSMFEWPLRTTPAADPRVSVRLNAFYNLPEPGPFSKPDLDRKLEHINRAVPLPFTHGVC